MEIIKSGRFYPDFLSAAENVLSPLLGHKVSRSDRAPTERLKHTHSYTFPSLIRIIHTCWKQGCGAVTFLVGSGSGSGSGEEFRLQLRLRLRVKLFGRLRLRLRLRLREKCTGSGGSGSGSGSDDQVLI